ncbi:lyase family protein [Occallatibacter riparius]|uniref:Lyase family protein n=1 Tax=Occallatibacter riparius TaxID=1002689 RepID=A0A9J7BWZ0_9BACT|nr:lyase family protein [Occallatibacter riparius]UWZ85573.1 lyase family protein [Occallatibacter riparius]
MTDSLNSFLFTTPAMAHAFSPEAQLRAMARFEWALTCALEKAGLAETGSSSILESLLDIEFVNFESLQREARDVGNIAIPFVRQLTSAVKQRDEAASRAIHLGATSQDLLDTALMLQIRVAGSLLNSSLDRLEIALTKQIRDHAHTILTGRTWLQPGPPTTLGLKLAGTLTALRRSCERLHAALHQATVLQLGGAVGTLSVLREAGQEVSAELARILNLREPELPWHTQRDRIVEIVQVLALLTGSLAKFARDIALLMQSEVGEAGEATGSGLGGSSTMPHKHNPVACAAVLAAHARMPALVSTMLYVMPQEHERGVGLWQAEWDTVPEAFRLTAAALEYSVQIAETMQVNTARMQANFDDLLGITMSEAVSAALAPKIGRSAAHALLRRAADRALREKRHLGDILKETPDLLHHLSPEDIDRLLDPRAYLGSAQRFIDNVSGDPDARS